MNYYSVLGIEPTATSEQIKAAYRKLARQHHPDSGGDAEKFKQVTEAYDVLKDPHKRAAFDHRSTRIHINAGDVFDDLHAAFTFKQRQTQQRRNKNLTIEVEINLEETLTDTSKTVSIKHVNGKRKFVNVTIPKGTVTGNLKYRGLGDHSHSDVSPGDLLVKVVTKTHPDFVVEGTDLKQSITISVWEAMLGTSVRVKTLSAKMVQVQIPAGTQHGTVLNVPGHGIPKHRTDDSLGRLLLEILIKIPQNLTQEQLNIIRNNFLQG
jgi:curved DNA-binding protein